MSESEYSNELGNNWNIPKLSVAFKQLGHDSKLVSERRIVSAIDQTIVIYLSVTYWPHPVYIVVHPAAIPSAVSLV